MGLKATKLTRRWLLSSFLLVASKRALAQPAAARPLSTADSLSPFSFGAKGDGFADDTAAFEAALATGGPVNAGVGRFRLTRGLKLKSGQALLGISARSCAFIVDHDFERNAPAVIDIQSPEPGGELRDLTIAFSHPDIGRRDGLLPYPPAIRAPVPRFKLSRLRIERARVGIDMRGNAGGVTIDDIEISAFDRAIWIDGSLDSVKIMRLHIWPFGLTKAQRTIYDDNITEGLRVGRCDDFHLSDSIIFGLRKAAIFHHGEKGTAFGTLSSVDFDHCGGLICEAGNLRVMGCIFTLGVPDGFWMKTGQDLVTVVGAWFHANKPVTEAGISSHEEGVLVLNACTFSTGDLDFVHIDIGAQTTCNLSNLVFRKVRGKSFTQPLIRLRPGTVGTISNLIATPAAEGDIVQQGAAPTVGVAGYGKAGDRTFHITNVLAPGWRLPN